MCFLGIAIDLYKKPLQSGVAAFKDSKADCIVAIGGGSSMDTAKAIGIIIETPNLQMSRA